LKVVLEELREANALDRQLAAALHALSFHASGLIDGWAIRGKQWRHSLVYEELPAIYVLIDSIFEV